jgi:putative ABC transport system permease protein
VRLRDRLFRLVLRLYPEDFRDRFGDDMEAAYRDARMDAAMRGRRGVAQFWWGVAADALVRAPGEHMRMTFHDLRYAARALRRTPMFTLVAIATLALGIGANTAIFSVVHAVALQPLPNADSARLVRLWEKNDTLRIPRFSASVPNYVSWRERAHAFEDLAAWRGGSATLTTGGEPQRVSKLEATATVFPLLGIQPAAGRAFSAEEDRPGAATRVVLLAESLWRSRFGASPTLVGQPIVLDGVSHTVIGIVRDRDFVVPVQLVTPLAADVARENRSNHMITVVARLRPGVTLEQAQREMDAIALQLGKDYPKDDAGWGVTMATFYDWIVPEATRRGLYVLLASVGVVLLIACTNIANLTLARSALRRREQAVRLALGASRARVVRDVLTESVLLALIGGAAGVLIAYWALPFFRTQLATVLPRAGDIALNAQVLAFALAVSVATGLLFGTLPAVFDSNRDVIGALKDSGRAAGARHHGLARRLLVVGQLALATMLLAAAALLVQSFVRLQRVDLGFQASRLTTAMIGLPASRYPNHAAGWQFYSRVVDAISSTAGVEAVGLSSGAPLAGGNTAMPMKAVGANALDTRELQADWRQVSPEYFRAMGIPLLRGRTFAATDRQGGQNVIILSSDMARRFWPDGEAVGRSMVSGSGATFLVVGVVGDVRNVNQAVDPRPTMYLSTTQFLWPTMTLVVRSRGDAPIASTVRTSVNAIDPELAVFNVRTMATLIDTNSAQPRVTAWLFGMFAALALLLAAIGVYGVLAYLVTQRTREIGVRLALGAKPASVLRLVVGHSLRLSVTGIVIGAIGALLAGPALESQLFGVRPRDPVTLAAVTVGLLAIALLASYVPARRATRVNPLTALRAE